MTEKRGDVWENLRGMSGGCENRVGGQWDIHLLILDFWGRLTAAVGILTNTNINNEIGQYWTRKREEKIQ